VKQKASLQSQPYDREIAHIRKDFVDVSMKLIVLQDPSTTLIDLENALWINGHYLIISEFRKQLHQVCLSWEVLYRGS
jgi:hypothetical protein